MSAFSQILLELRNDRSSPTSKTETLNFGEAIMGGNRKPLTMSLMLLVPILVFFTAHSRAQDRADLVFHNGSF